MKRYSQFVLTILLAVVLFACSPATPASPEATPTVAGEFHPLTTRTNIQEVDQVIEIVASDNPESLRSLIQFTNTKCTRAEGLGGPPKCRAGEVEGTPVDALPIFGSEGHFIYKEDIEEWPGVQADGLYAVYEVSSEVVSDPDYPSGMYAVMFTDKANQTITSLRVEDGKIVRVDYILDNSPNVVNGWIEREAAKVILAPVGR
jgi:hypothetical protein